MLVVHGYKMQETWSSICAGGRLSDTLKGRVWRCKSEVKKEMQGRPQQGRDARFIEYLLRKDVGNKKRQLRTLQAVGTL